MRPNAGGGGELWGLSQWVQLYTGSQINFGDLTPYLTYGRKSQYKSLSLWTDTFHRFQTRRPNTSNEFLNYLDINNLKTLRMLKTGNVLVVKNKATRCLGGGWRAWGSTNRQRPEWTAQTQAMSQQKQVSVYLFTAGQYEFYPSSQGFGSALI